MHVPKTRILRRGTAIVAAAALVIGGAAVATIPSAQADEVPSGPIVSLDDPRLTPEQRERGTQLLNETRAAMQRFPDVASVEAAGYRTIGDAGTGFEHFVNAALIQTPETLNPDAIESIVFQVDRATGVKRPVSAMYIAGPGTTMETVPEVAGPLSVWHDHQNLCWDDNGRIAGILIGGRCLPGGTFQGTTPMLHVWLEDQPCGPFTGIEGSHGGGCDDDHHGPTPTTTSTTRPPTTTSTTRPPTTTSTTRPTASESPFSRIFSLLMRLISGLFG